MIEQELRYIPTLSVRPGISCVYNQYVGSRWRSIESRVKSTENLKDNKTKGYLSTKAKKRIVEAVEWLCLFSVEKRSKHPVSGRSFKWRNSFVTLTLSSAQIHDDKEIKRKVWNRFIVACSRKFKMQNYVWKAEAQKNGNIHFHLITDVWMDRLELRKVWNECQEGLGYISRSGLGLEANSTDVHSFRKVENVAAYVGKYMSKSAEVDRKIEGKVWGCSKNISECKSVKVELVGDMADQLQYAVESNEIELIEREHCFMLKKSAKYMIDKFKSVYEGFIVNYQKFKGIFVEVVKEAIVEPIKVELCQSLSRMQKLSSQLVLDLL